MIMCVIKNRAKKSNKDRIGKQGEGEEQLQIIKRLKKNTFTVYGDQLKVCKSEGKESALILR